MNAKDEMIVEMRIRSLPDDVPAIHRLRRLLKAMLRCYDFRVEDIRQIHPEKPNGAVQETRYVG